MLKVISTNVVETQAGENEGMQQDEDKALVRESNKIDASELRREEFRVDRGFKVEDDVGLCGAHLALPAFTIESPSYQGKIFLSMHSC